MLCFVPVEMTLEARERREIGSWVVCSCSRLSGWLFAILRFFSSGLSEVVRGQRWFDQLMVISIDGQRLSDRMMGEGEVVS